METYRHPRNRRTQQARNRTGNRWTKPKSKRDILLVRPCASGSHFLSVSNRITRQEAIVNSKVQISLWHRSQSKKKSKKRSLVATASHTLGELFSKQEGSKTSTSFRNVYVICFVFTPIPSRRFQNSAPMSDFHSRTQSRQTT